MLDWKNEYEIGIKMIDEQHKHLFEIGNRAYELLKDEFSIDKYDKIVDIVNELKEYTKYHFRCEEDYMIKINYKRYRIQKTAHDNFIKKIYSIDLKKIDENQNKYIEDLLKFVFNWIIEHILHEDMLIKNI